MSAIARMLGNIVLYALTGYVALALILFVFQRKLLYLPGDFKPPEEQLQQEGLQYWPSAENYRGLKRSTDPTDVVGTVIVFHGNAGTAYHRRFYIDALAPHKLRVILAEYPGYGGREGEPDEDALVRDAIETLQIAYQTFGGPIFLWGESLGSGVVSGVVSQTDIPLQGLAFFTPWDSLSNVAQTHYWYVPARWLLRDAYDNVQNLRQFEGNVAVMLAGHDQVIPVPHGKALYESITTNKKLWVFEGAGHNSVPIRADLPWWKEVLDFMAQ